MLAGLFLALLVSATLGYSPVFADPFLPFRMIALLSFTGLAVVSLAFDKKLLARASASSLLITSTLTWLILQLIFDALRKGGGSTSMGISQDLAIACLSVISLHIMEKEADFLYNLAWLNTLLASFISALGMAQLAGLAIPWFPSAILQPESLGNMNMIAEYLGFSLALSIFLLGREDKFIPRLLVVIASACMLTYPLLIVCRSVLIGICLVLAFSIINQRLKATEAVTLVLITSFLSILIARPASHSTADPVAKTYWVNRASEATNAAILNRTFGSQAGQNFLRIKTIEMIKIHPWLGFGRGSYEQAASKYLTSQNSPFRSETILVKNPRNEPLQVLSELGLPLGGLLILGFIGLLGKVYLSVRKNKNQDERLQLAVYLSLILMIEAYYQAPLQIPVGMIFFSLLLGLLFSFLPSLPKAHVPIAWIRMALFFMALAFLVQAGRLAFAEYSYAHKNLAKNQVARACQLLPEHWRVCLRYSEELMSEGRWQELNHITQARLTRYPGFHPSERIAALSAWNQGQKQDACVMAQRYQSQFQNQNSLRFIYQKCNQKSQ